MSRNCFRLNEPDVSAEDFNSAILAVNLKNGYYHSLSQSAVPIWRLLMEGCDISQIVQWLAPIYGCTPENLTPDVQKFVAGLEQAQLIVPAAETVAPAQAPAWLSVLTPPYFPPVLEIYTDMQELLLLDPIHDVDVRGWPNVPGPGPSGP